MRVLGMDLGSRRVKICSMVEGQIEKQEKYGTVDFYKNYCKNIDGKIHVNFEKLGFSIADKNIATGYGRNNMGLYGFEIINELKAHTYGAMFATGLKEFGVDYLVPSSQIFTMLNIFQLQNVSFDGVKTEVIFYFTF